MVETNSHKATLPHSKKLWELMERCTRKSPNKVLKWFATTVNAKRWNARTAFATRETSLKDQLKNNNIFLRNQKFNSRVILKASQKNNSNKFLKKLSKASKPAEEMKVMSL